MTTYERAVLACKWLNEHCIADRFTNFTADYKGSKRACGGKFVHSERGGSFKDTRVIDGTQVIAFAVRSGWKQ